MEQLRRVLVYETFIAHFIEMAKMSFKFQALNQTLIYLKQASRLCSLLKDDQHSCDAFITQIEALHRDVLGERNRDSQTRPQLPRRESAMEISNKIKFRIKMSRSNSRNVEDPYSNITFIKQQHTQASEQYEINPLNENDNEDSEIEADDANKMDDRSLRFNRYLAPHNRPQLKRQKSNLVTTVQVHSRQSPKAPIKCVNFFDDDELSSSGNNSPIIHISECPKSPLAACAPKAALVGDKENFKNDINKIHLVNDLIQQHSDNGINDHTEL